ncbi:PucR family transcriptional regulator [Amycolatopsis palatopharyngis]|uniref:PucR family transcriptional regulator n=1 Tax=Amycolatopsis palatopharyngis TaxID=187982 RepID=UPI000E221FE9|nr:PucR family transcriptional regulator [Amycolatopsis palatopharyngis]
MSEQQLQEQLDALAVELRRGLTIDSVSGDLLAYSAQRDDADQVRISSILTRHVAPEVREWELRHAASEPFALPANPGIGMSARLCVPLRRNGRTLGYLWMVGTRDGLGSDERAALLRGADTLAGLLRGATDVEVRPRPPGPDLDRLVRRLLEDGQVEAYDQIVVSVPGIVDRVVRVVAIVVSDNDGAVRPLRPTEFSTLNGSLSADLRRLDGLVGAFVSRKYALLAVHQGDCGENLRQTLDEIDLVVSRCLVDGTRFTIGISDGISLGPRSARDARTQALTAAELAVLDPKLDRRAWWSEIGIYRMLFDTRDRIGDVLKPVDEAGPSAPMLLTTLETYLDLAGDVQKVAARLSLHRSSLYYRLDRLSRLLQADLSDGMIRLELHTALKLRRVARRTLN